MNAAIDRSNCALVISHPGHELRVLGWLKAVRPLVVILTDGAGHSHRPRIELSRKIIEDVGARPASVFGSRTDRQMYEAMLGGNVAFFEELRDDIAQTLAAEDIELLAGDSVEGYNPSHDVCRCLIESAIRQVAAQGKRVPRNYEFPLVGSPDLWAQHPHAFCRELTPEELSWKRDTIRAYAKAVGGTLEAEVREALDGFGEGVLAREWFSPVTTVQNFDRFESEPPFYERHGERQVAKGHYRTPIRFREHLGPICQALAKRIAA
jgi:hypothetical protein